jgi:hypothetical protein
MGAVKGFFRLIIGTVFGFASALVLIPAFAAFTESADASGASQTWPVWLVTLLGSVLGVFAPTIRRAFGRGFLMVGLAVFALPLSMMLLSGRVAGDMMSTAATGDAAATAIGAGLAASFVTGVSAFVGFFLGAISIVTGLILALGGEREIVVTREPGVRRG